MKIHGDPACHVLCSPSIRAMYLPHWDWRSYRTIPSHHCDVALER